MRLYTKKSPYAYWKAGQKGKAVRKMALYILAHQVVRSVSLRLFR